MNKKRIWIIAIVLAVSLVMCAIQVNRKSVLLPHGKGLPEMDIVFHKETNTLGFIQSDGTGYIELKVKPTGGFISDLKRFYVPPQISPYATWSLDGKYLALSVGYYNPYAGSPLIFSESGETIQCKSGDRLSIGGRIWVTKEKKMVAMNASFMEKDSVVILDMITCENIKELYKLNMGDYDWAGLRDMTYSNQGWLAISIATRKSGIDKRFMIILDDRSHEVFTIPSVLYPSWSRDGEWLAYVLENDGLYIIDKYGKEKQKILDGDYYEPSWSPDGQWIAYLDGHDIFKVNIVTKKISMVYDGYAQSLSWRWR